MSDEASVLFMIRLALRADCLVQLAAKKRLPLHSLDEGYLVHCQLIELFGDLAPQPFAVVGQDGRHLSLLGYSSSNAAALRGHADTFADPAAHAACNWAALVDKPMPTSWRVGQRLGFQVRGCPVVRMAKDGAHHRKGAEVDAFLARCWAVGDPAVPVEREAVYAEWLNATVARHQGAAVAWAAVRAFKRARIIRRTHELQRKAATMERPDVLFAGELDVTDGERFTRMLRRGVGRHRAFGFGMVLLRPLGNGAC